MARVSRPSAHRVAPVIGSGDVGCDSLAIFVNREECLVRCIDRHAISDDDRVKLDEQHHVVLVLVLAVAQLDVGCPARRATRVSAP